MPGEGLVGLVGRVGRVGLVGRVGVALAALLMAASASAQSASCDRGCLESMLETYVDAVAARSPDRLPVAAGVVFTENGQRLELGDGLWHTATARGRYALRLADVETGQAVFMGTVREADTAAILVVRLAVRERRLREIETLVIRNEAAAKSLDTIGAPRATWTQAVPAAERHPRADLVRIANMYFSGIERNDGKGRYPIADSCARLENGTVTAGDPAVVLGAEAAAGGGRVGSTGAPASGLPAAVRDRRLPLRHAHPRPAVRAGRSRARPGVRVCLLRQCGGRRPVRNARRWKEGRVGAERAVDVADLRGLQDREGAHRPGGVGAPPCALWHGLWMEHVAGGDVQRASMM